MCVLDLVLNHFPLITEIFADDGADLQSVPGNYFFGICCFEVSTPLDLTSKKFLTTDH